MNLTKGSQLLVLSQLAGAGESGETVTAFVTKVLPDVSTGNTDPAVAPVICDVIAFPPGRVGLPLTFNVYDVRSSGGNATLDQHGFAFVTDDSSTTVLQGVVGTHHGGKR